MSKQEGTREEVRVEVVPVRVRELRDLARAVAAIASFGSTPLQMPLILHFERDGQHVYGTVVTLHAFRSYHGLPVFLYLETDSPLEGNYVLVRTDTDTRKEELEIAYAIKRGWLAIPIINLAEKPAFVPL
ncbi:hypothetical protein DRN94_002110 [archaeon]|nr:hypothetical protein [archaeon]